MSLTVQCDTCKDPDFPRRVVQWRQGSCRDCAEDLVSRHLAEFPDHTVVEEHRQATGRDPETVPWLIGVYPPESVGGLEGKGGVFSYGYKPTLRGRIDVPRARWHRLIPDTDRSKP
jgi:hypothetical protein